MGLSESFISIIRELVATKNNIVFLTYEDIFKIFDYGQERALFNWWTIVVFMGLSESFISISRKLATNSYVSSLLGPESRLCAKKLKEELETSILELSPNW